MDKLKFRVGIILFLIHVLFSHGGELRDIWK